MLTYSKTSTRAFYTWESDFRKCTYHVNFFFNFCSISLYPLFAAGPKYYFAGKTSRVETVIHERGILRFCENTILEICQDQRLNMMCFVCNQQHSLKLVFTIRLSYLEKFSSSCSLPLWLVCSTSPGERTFFPLVIPQRWAVCAFIGVWMDWVTVLYRWLEIRTTGHLCWGLNQCCLPRIYWEYSDHVTLT